MSNFETEFLPNIKPATVTYAKWRTNYKASEAPKWDAYLPKVLAHKKGEPAPAAPVFKSRFGNALLAAAEQHMSVVDLGAVWGQVVITSSINDGDTVQQGEVWTISTNLPVEAIEFWVDGVLETDSTSPYQKTIDLQPGTYQYNICYWKGGVRTCLDPGNGVLGVFTVAGQQGQGFDIPTWQVVATSTAGEGNPEAFQSWLYYSYPTTPNPADWGGGPPLANLWTPQADPVQGSWEWWWLYSIFIPSNWDESTEGSMNALGLDAHNRPGDVGWDFQPGCASGVSSIHLKYRDNALMLQHERQQDDNTGPHEWSIATIQKGVWHSVACQFILGRLDGTIPSAGHPNGGRGRTRVYVDGPLALDTGDINILQRDRCTGQVQKIMSCLQGLYNGGMTATHTAQLTVARVGKTLAQALAMSTFNFQMVFYNNSGLNPDGSPRFHTWSQITPRTSAQFVTPQV